MVGCHHVLCTLAMLLQFGLVFELLCTHKTTCRTGMCRGRYYLLLSQSWQDYQQRSLQIDDFPFFSCTTFFTGLAVVGSSCGGCPMILHKCRIAHPLETTQMYPAFPWYFHSINMAFFSFGISAFSESQNSSPSIHIYSILLMTSPLHSPPPPQRLPISPAQHCSKVFCFT